MWPIPYYHNFTPAACSQSIFVPRADSPSQSWLDQSPSTRTLPLATEHSSPAPPSLLPPLPSPPCFRMLTGESWDQVMQDCMVTSDCVLVTAPGGINATDPASTNSTILIPPGTYLNPSDPVLNGLPEDAFDNQCALSPFAAAFYFPTFVVLCTFILLQLVIAVLLENLVQVGAGWAGAQRASWC